MRHAECLELGKLSRPFMCLLLPSPAPRLPPHPRGLSVQKLPLHCRSEAPRPSHPKPKARSEMLRYFPTSSCLLPFLCPPPEASGGISGGMANSACVLWIHRNHQTCASATPPVESFVNGREAVEVPTGTASLQQTSGERRSLNADTQGRGTPACNPLGARDSRESSGSVMRFTIGPSGGYAARADDSIDNAVAAFSNARQAENDADSTARPRWKWCSMLVEYCPLEGHLSWEGIVQPLGLHVRSATRTSNQRETG